MGEPTTETKTEKIATGEEPARRTKTEETVSKGTLYTITAYCPCVKCCGKSDGITASGVKAVEGVTVAMNKSIPFGTKIYIDGVGERIVQDRGGAIKGNKIDLYFDSHDDALKWGRQTKQVTILN
jgi:3D (Asp-Asp-Asp) domain-containing protein